MPRTNQFRLCDCALPTKPTLQREYSLGDARRQNPDQLSRRRQYLYEIEQLLNVEFDALTDSRPRLTNEDLKNLFKALLDEFDAEPCVVVFHDRGQYELRQQLKEVSDQ